MMLLSSYIWPVRSLGRIVSDLGKCSVAAGRIKEILDEKVNMKMMQQDVMRSMVILFLIM